MENGEWRMMVAISSSFQQHALPGKVANPLISYRNNSNNQEAQGCVEQNE
jgi:hypothetical protein